MSEVNYKDCDHLKLYDSVIATYYQVMIIEEKRYDILNKINKIL